MHCHAGWPPMFVPPPFFLLFFMCLISVLAALRCLLIILEKKCSEGFSLLGRGFAQVVWNDITVRYYHKEIRACHARFTHARISVRPREESLGHLCPLSCSFLSSLSLTHSRSLSISPYLMSLDILPFVILSLYLTLLSTSNDEELHYTAMFH